jgi:hypothetical protein
MLGRNQCAWPDAGRLKNDVAVLRRDEMSDIRKFGKKCPGWIGREFVFIPLFAEPEIECSRQYGEGSYFFGMGVRHNLGFGGKFEAHDVKPRLGRVAIEEGSPGASWRLKDRM